MKISIDKESGMWVIRKGKTILCENFATGKVSFRAESRLSIDDIFACKTFKESVSLLMEYSEKGEK